MPKTEPPDPAPRRVVAPCGLCGNPMHIVKAAPHSRFINLDLVTHVCDCGHATETIVAREA